VGEQSRCATKILGFIVEELRRLMATRSVLLKMLQRPNADREK
jgi:hypothetical protein